MGARCYRHVPPSAQVTAWAIYVLATAAVLQPAPHLSCVVVGNLLIYFVQLPQR